MHLPDAWGTVIFAPEAAVNVGQVPSPSDYADSIDTAHAAAMCLYYAQHAHREVHGIFAPTVDTLQAQGLLDEATLARQTVTMELRAEGCGAEGGRVEGDAGGGAEGEQGSRQGFSATARDEQTGAVVSVSNDRFVSIRHE
uniref:Uncharacterized protein n=1 Tax=Haptolina brevifila TaxID=156173 RepID=A0A7S2GVV3_9EUKA|mmetsp:Transcript_48172/g.96071  ORF Transcript_48172/g.96071 Transcript_48172/m.96071 type:complete len:141 (+) Transcript_48172:176-598(+)